jgi:hypothetical protein
VFHLSLLFHITTYISVWQHSSEWSLRRIAKSSVSLLPRWKFCYQRYRPHSTYDFTPHSELSASKQKQKCSAWETEPLSERSQKLRGFQSRKRTIQTERPPLVGEVSANFLRVESVAWSAQRIPTAVNLGFLDRSRYFSIQVAPQLSSRGWRAWAKPRNS